MYMMHRKFANDQKWRSEMCVEPKRASWGWAEEPFRAFFEPAHQSGNRKVLLENPIVRTNNMAAIGVRMTP
jgi:hypothetical protein